MKKKILCALLCSLLVFSHSNVSVYAASQALSSEYQNSELRNDYIGTMTYQVPNGNMMILYLALQHHALTLLKKVMFSRFLICLTKFKEPLQMIIAVRQLLLILL